MKTLKIENFKAHQELNIPFNNKNFLLYGDNGSGKSSIYEALKVIFYEDRIKQNITKKTIPENQDAVISEFWSEYNNTISNKDFSLLLVDGDTDNKIDTSKYQVFMFGIEDLNFDKILEIDKLISKVYFNIKFDNSRYAEIETKVNVLLKKFLEDIEIEIDREDNSIKIKDEDKSIALTKDIKRYFNEAKVNLVLLSILFVVIELYQDESKKKILVLDDFITSLDVSNRTFVMKHILDTFNKRFQIVILTHNVYFYNLIMYLINDIYKYQDKWQYSNLYEMKKESKLYINPSKNKKLELDKLNEQLANEHQLDDLGNKVRQKFEILLYELSKILMVGGVEESKNILDELICSDKLYLFKDGKKLKGSLSLIYEIERVLSSNGNIETIQDILSKYRISNLTEIRIILKDLKLYQKVHMHPLSHGQISDSSFNITEAKTTILLLEKLESNIFSLLNKKVDGA